MKSAVSQGELLFLFGSRFLDGALLLGLLFNSLERHAQGCMFLVEHWSCLRVLEALVQVPKALIDLFFDIFKFIVVSGQRHVYLSRWHLGLVLREVDWLVLGGVVKHRDLPFYLMIDQRFFRGEETFANVGVSAWGPLTCYFTHCVFRLEWWVFFVLIMFELWYFFIAILYVL